MAAVTKMSAIGPATAYPYLYPKNVSTPGVYGQRIFDFDLWRELYGGVIVYIRKAGSTVLARVYTDPTLQTLADNPQTLLTQTLDGVRYGKFLAPLYTPDAYYCDIDSTDQTGISRPSLYKLDDEDGDRILVTAQGGRVARALENHVAQTVWAEDYGRIGTSPTENTATITAAIGQAGARGGGFVMLPPRSIDITRLNLPTGVVLRGFSKAATTVRSTVAEAIITLSGAGAGLMDMTMDGVNVSPGSIGVLSEQQDDILLRQVEVKRFETCLHLKGGERARFDRLSLSNGTYGARLQGDTAPLRNLWWTGGQITQHTTAGVWFEWVDADIAQITMEELGFVDNLSDGLLLEGTQFVRCVAGTFDDSGRSIKIIDGSDPEAAFTSNIRFERCEVTDATCHFDGACIDVVFTGSEFLGTEFDLEPTMGKHLVLRDCSEDSNVRLSGDGTRLIRQRSGDKGAVVGTTTDATPVKAFALNLGPGETVMMVGRIVANAVNAEVYAAYHISQAARRDTADLSFDTGTIAFVLGDIVVGATSGASAYITAKTGTTASGSLSLRSVVGTFQNNEALQVDGVTRALVNGSISNPTVSLLGSIANLYINESDTTMACVFAASGDEAQIQVTGISATTFEWTAEMDVLRG